MVRFVLPLIICCLFGTFACGQTVSLSMIHDGSGRILVEEPNDAPPKQFRLSSDAMDFMLRTTLDELLDAQIRGEGTYSYMERNDLDRDISFSMLEMNSDQLNRLAQKQFELYENTKGDSNAIYEQLSQFDSLSPEDALIFEQDFRKSMQEQSQNGRQILNDVLTPSQLQQLAELEFVTGAVAGFSVLNPQAYASLGLSDKQQEELLNHFKNSKAEITENFLAMMRDVEMGLGKILYAHEKFDKNGTDDFEKKIDTLLQSLSKEEMKKIQDQIQTLQDKSLQKQKAFGERFQKGIDNVLMPHQREQYKKRIAALSEKLERVKKEQITKQKEPQDDSWKKSWKPGDPLPEGAVPPLPPSRFPRGLF